MTFDCDEARRWVDAWIDHELDPSAALHVETHLARCAACRAEAEMLRTLKGSLGALREDCAPTALRMRVLAQLDAVDDRRELERAAVRRRRHAAGFVLTGAALAGVVLVRGWQARMEAQEHDPAGLRTMAGMVPIIEDVARRHAHELPAEVRATDPHEVAQWFRGKIDIPIRPMHFRGMSAQLVGARISNVWNRSAAALFYDLGGRRITVFVYDGGLMPHAGAVHEVAGGRDWYVASSHGYTVTFTEQQGVGYAVASDLPPRDCVRVVANAELH